MKVFPQTKWGLLRNLVGEIINQEFYFMSTIKKKLLILGGNPETGYLVKHANKLGIHTIVLDPNKDSPAKKHAAESYEVDGLDINGIKRVFEAILLMDIELD